MCDSCFAFAAVRAVSALDAAPIPRNIPPASLRRVRGTSRSVRTLNAVLATISDVKRQIIGDAIASGGGVTNGSRTGGLRSGLAIYTDGLITLRKVVYVPGVEVSGFVALNASSGQTHLLLRGRAASRGNITISSTGRITGVLGGRRVSTQVVGAAHRSGGLTAPDFPHPALRAR